MAPNVRFFLTFTIKRFRFAFLLFPGFAGKPKCGKFLSAFPASLERLKREALKNLMENTGKAAEEAFAEILETVRRLTFTVLTH